MAEETTTQKTIISATPEQSGESDLGNISLLLDVPLAVSVELGRARMTLRQALDLQDGSVVALDRIAGDPVDVYVNDRMIARGEVVVVDDKFAVRITELISKSGKPGQRTV